MTEEERDIQKILDRGGISCDWKDPEWHVYVKCNCWRNYATDAIKAIWGTFTNLQKVYIAEMMQDQADNEHWD